MQMFNKRSGALFSLFIALSYSVLSSYANKTNELILEKEGENILKKLNSSVPICDDFFEFVCGNYQPEIPSHKTKIDELDLVKDKLQEQLNKDFKTVASDNDSNPIKNVKTFYSNCMDTDTIELLALNPIKNILRELGGWPIIPNDEWNESSWRWQDVVMKIEDLGFSSNYLFDISAGPDYKNTSRRVIMFDQPSLGLSKEYFSKGLDNELVRAYKKYQVDFAVIFGAKVKDAQKEMFDVLLFEKSLADISLAKEERRNSTKLYNPIKIRDLQVIFPSLNLVDYINVFLLPADRVDSDEIVVISNRTFFVKLHELIEKTSSRTIANYMMWRASSSVAMRLNKEVRQRSLEFSKVVTGVLDFEPRWKECVGCASSSLPIASSALYVKNHFNEKSRSIAKEMVTTIRNKFKENLNTVEWMDEETRSLALGKLDKMEKHIGYPDELVDDNILNKYYENLTVEKDEYLNSYLKLNRFHVAHDMKKFRLPVNKTDWEYHSNVAIANAYYHWLQNSITIPAGILQEKFFSADRPNYMNYGAIGYVIGHEITHGFDDQGRQFDQDGNLVEWWREDTKKAYLDKAKCIIEQYGNYTEPLSNLKLNGINTQGENIADNGGVLFAYRAYQKWSKENGVEEPLPGLNFTSNQLFWITLGQTWCSAYRTEEIKHRITTGVHSIARFRIIGPLSNIKEFSDDFQCPIGSPMNPKNKCKVW